MDTNKTFAYRLCRSLAQCGWEQKDLAGALGCSDSIVSDWVCGKRVPPYKTLIRAADAMGVSPYWLLFAADEYSQARDEWERQLLRSVRHLDDAGRAKLQRHFADYYTWEPVPTRDEPQLASPLSPDEIAARVAEFDRPTTASDPISSRSDMHALCDRIAEVLDDPAIDPSPADVEALRRVYALVLSRFAARETSAGPGTASSDVPSAGTGIVPEA